MFNLIQDEQSFGSESGLDEARIYIYEIQRTKKICGYICIWSEFDFKSFTIEIKHFCFIIDVQYHTLNHVNEMKISQI